MKNNKTNLTKELFIPVFNFIKKKKYEEALNLLEKLLDQNQNPDIINKLKGSVYLNQKKWKHSLLNYQKISENKINFEIANNMGVALYKLGRFSEASIKFKQSINNNNSYIPAYENFCVTNKILGNYDLSIKFSLKALKLMPTNNKLKNNLIDIFNYYEPKNDENSILKTNNQIRKLNLENQKNKLIQISNINEILNKSQEIIENSNLTFNYPNTQIFKKNTINLNCERHLDIFSNYKIIPKFCFNCYKVQITLNNVLDLLKLYFYFNNLTLKKNNTRKCIIELRNNIVGNYKGYIFTDTIVEAKNILNIISKDLVNKEIELKKIEIKHGCTEYYDDFKIYKDIDKDVVDKIYQDKWMYIEKKYDEKNLILENNNERVFNDTLKVFNLSDFLIIKNWLLYAKIIGDNTYEKIYKFNLNTNQLSQSEMEKISLRKKDLFN